MLIGLLVAATLVLTGPVGRHSQEKTENRFKTAKIGDYVVYQETFTFNGRNFDSEMKQTVVAKTEKKATLQTATSAAGGKALLKQTIIDLTKPYDPIAAVAEGKWDKTGAGKEKVTIGAKTYDCDWISAARVRDSGGNKVDEHMKIWLDKSVLAGAVKMKIDSWPRGTWFLSHRRMQITELGAAK
jgi:hypothetical protein